MPLRSHASEILDSIGLLALLVPIIGTFTLVGTISLACMNQFSCARRCPTLSYAAEYDPQKTFFSIGMSLTALFIAISTILQFVLVQTRISIHKSKVDKMAAASNRQEAESHVVESVLSWISTLSLVTCSVALVLLAIYDMGNYHVIHVLSCSLFFVFSWIGLIALTCTRVRLLRRELISDGFKDGKVAVCISWNEYLRLPLDLTKLVRRCWSARGTSAGISSAYRIGIVFMVGGLLSTIMFGLMFMSVNGNWSNPLGFTATQEALFEFTAILSQLMCFGTAASELAWLGALLQRHDYVEVQIQA
uniref:Uncharacterized protein AlNc14C191G8450 n=1 Tax=Albugo laibachii Nc14 TaxID=890382 RepID=F0WPV9_9STRA|nr:conserved hypothetical protein [Albugo laibachii Nc14]|eukprot:CCA23360.1 conserved hypothetical protein [Albugo laibachii Nc14]